MKIYELPFGKFIELNDAFVEVIIYEGIELTVDMIDQFQYYFTRSNSDPFGVLINKINQYTYAFDAQIRLSELLNLDAIAVVTYSQRSKRITESIISLQRGAPWNIKIFDDRRTAIEWLKAELAKKKSLASQSI